MPIAYPFQAILCKVMSFYRCRFAEKLADRYLKIVEETKEEKQGGGESKLTQNGSSFSDLEGIDLLK